MRLLHLQPTPNGLMDATRYEIVFTADAEVTHADGSTEEDKK